MKLKFIVFKIEIKIDLIDKKIIPSINASLNHIKTL